MKLARGSPSVDWASIRDTIDLAAVVTRHLGPAVKRRGHRLSWVCPFPGHDDHEPSFHVDTGKQRWRCWPCELGGDAASFIMRYCSMPFPDAIAYLTEGTSPTTTARPTTARTKP